MVAVVGAVGDDDVVEETDVHQLAGTGKGLGEVVVHLAGVQTARGVVVAHGHDGGVGQQGFLHEDADVDQHFADAAVGDALQQLLEAVMDGRVPNEKDELNNFVSTFCTIILENTTFKDITDTKNLIYKNQHLR